MPDPYAQQFFHTYKDEHNHTLQIIKHAQTTSPSLFHKLTSLINAAATSKHHGLVSILPELTALLHNEGAPHLASEYVTYARFISDVKVSADGLPESQTTTPRKQKQQKQIGKRIRKRERKQPARRRGHVPAEGPGTGDRISGECALDGMLEA